jgi:hypothetical protein
MSPEALKSMACMLPNSAAAMPPCLCAGAQAERLRRGAAKRSEIADVVQRRGPRERSEKITAIDRSPSSSAPVQTISAIARRTFGVNLRNTSGSFFPDSAARLSWSFNQCPPCW